MNKKELRQTIGKMIDIGKSKQEIFEELSSKGENTSTVARLIALHPNKQRYEDNYGKINILITAMFFLALFNAFNGHSVGLKFGSTYAWVLTFLGALAPLLYAYGFFKNYANAYNIFIILGSIELLRSLIAFFDMPLPIVVVSADLAFNVLFMVFVWYLRSRLFPDIYILGPKKINQHYVFTS